MSVTKSASWPSITARLFAGLAVRLIVNLILTAWGPPVLRKQAVELFMKIARGVVRYVEQMSLGAKEIHQDDDCVD